MIKPKSEWKGDVEHMRRIGKLGAAACNAKKAIPNVTVVCTGCNTSFVMKGSRYRVRLQEEVDKGSTAVPKVYCTRRCFTRNPSAAYRDRIISKKAKPIIERTPSLFS